jgi:hypothetical protein
MVLIYQLPNEHVRISRILLRNAMAGAAVRKIYTKKYSLSESVTYMYIRRGVLQCRYSAGNGGGRRVQAKGIENHP